jgi:hypothetical protein
MYPKNPLFQKCITCLESLPNIKATIQTEPYFSSEFLADGQLIINTPHATADYVCEIKTGITNELVEQVAEYFTNLGGRLKPELRPLLVTRNLSSLVVDGLLERNIEFIDVDGNIYLNRPEIYIVVRNQVSKDSVNKSLEITAATLQVMYALLCQPRLISIENEFEEKIADISGVSSKTVRSTFKKLQDLDYIRRIRKGYEINDYVKLFERWELGYSERLRTKLLLGTFSYIGERNLSEIENELRACSGVNSYLIGGELAASIITENIRPISTTLHLSQNFDTVSIFLKLKLKPDSNGNIVLLQSFGKYEYQRGNYKYRKPEFKLLREYIAHPLLIHAELVWTGNSRLKETAQLIYDKYIEEIAQMND